MWQTIETAPKDGTRVLAWYPNGGYQIVLEWNERCARWDDGFDGPRWRDHELSHWMPLPEPPEAP